jgi:predicted enzyme related to lactoylglutathione lyase
MLKLHVGDVDDAEAFYHAVFGATVAVELGEGARVLTMEEGPGFILLEDRPDDEDAWNGSFLIQVPDLAVAEAAAIDNGATHQQAFEGSPGGQQAQSVDLLDPWGNQIEILQLS